MCRPFDPTLDRGHLACNTDGKTTLGCYRLSPAPSRITSLIRLYIARGVRHRYKLLWSTRVNPYCAADKFSALDLANNRHITRRKRSQHFAIKPAPLLSSGARQPCRHLSACQSRLLLGASSKRIYQRKNGTDEKPHKGTQSACGGNLWAGTHHGYSNNTDCLHDAFRQQNLNPLANTSKVYK